MSGDAPSCRYPAWFGTGDSSWLQLLLATPVVFWAGWPSSCGPGNRFVNRHLNMFRSLPWAPRQLTSSASPPCSSRASSRHAVDEHGQPALTSRRPRRSRSSYCWARCSNYAPRRADAGAIRGLLELAPPPARLVHGEEVQVVPLADVSARRRAARSFRATRMPVDGVLTWGESTVDESMLTGDVPVESRGSRDGARPTNRARSASGPSEWGARPCWRGSSALVGEAQGRRTVQRLADRSGSVRAGRDGVAALTFLVWCCPAAAAVGFPCSTRRPCW